MMRRAAPLLLAVVAAGLSGCITLFPKEPPAQLFRFGDHVSPPTASGPPFAVRDAGLGFDRAASSDAILTISGNQVAYVAGGRWAVAAPLMFEAAVRKGFDAPGSVVRLIASGEPGPAPYVLRLNVTHFEAQYGAEPNAAPTIVVTLHAALLRSKDQSLVDAKPFEAKVAASENRVGAIAQAFDQATSQVVGDLVGWVSQTGAGAAATNAAAS